MKINYCEKIQIAHTGGKKDGLMLNKTKKPYNYSQKKNIKAFLFNICIVSIIKTFCN